MFRVLTNLPQDYTDDCEVLCFDGKPARNSSFDPKRLLSLDQIFKNLPENWVPDFIIFKSPQFFPIPIDIERSPILTIVLLDDWFGAIDFMPDNLTRFDYIFTDKYSVSLLKRMGFTNVDYWPCFGFDPAVFHVLEDEPKTIDVSFTGSFNSNIQTKRLPYLHRLCKLPEQYNVRLYHNLWKDEYVKVLNRSKIVFNRSIKGEMNMRCFEAPACNALLFIEEENQEIREYLEPDKECVVYNDNNLEERIDYYLKHDDERCCIAQAGHKKIQQFTYTLLFRELLIKIVNKNLVPFKNRKLPQQYTSSVLHRDFVQVNLSLRGRANDVIPIITNILEKGPLSSVTINDLAVVLLAYIEDRKTTLVNDEKEKLFSFCISLLEYAIKNQSNYLTPLFNLAQLFFFKEDYLQAGFYYKKLLQTLPTQDFNNYKGLVFPLHYFSPLRYLWSDALISDIGDESKLAKCRNDVLTYITCIRLGEISYSVGNHDEAQAWLKKAIALHPNHPAALTLYVSQIDIENMSIEDSELFTKSIEIDPFIFANWERYLQMLMNSEKYADAYQFAKASLLSLSRVQFADDTTISFFRDQLSNLSELALPAR